MSLSPSDFFDAVIGKESKAEETIPDPMKGNDVIFAAMEKEKEKELNYDSIKELPKKEETTTRRPVIHQVKSYKEEDTKTEDSPYRNSSWNHSSPYSYQYRNNYNQQQKEVVKKDYWKLSEKEIEKDKKKIIHCAILESKNGITKKENEDIFEIHNRSSIKSGFKRDITHNSELDGQPKSVKVPKIISEVMEFFSMPIITAYLERKDKKN